MADNKLKLSVFYYMMLTKDNKLQG